MQTRSRSSNNSHGCGGHLESDMAKFFDLGSLSNEFLELSEEGNDWEGIVCPKEPGHQRAGRRITDLHIDIMSKKVVDFSTTFLSDIVISDNALKILEAAGLTGFRVKPTHIHKYPKGLDPSTVPKFWEFVAIGEGGLSHPESGIVLRHKCDACGLVRYSAYEHGIVVNEATYDGSDFFTVTEYPRHVLVTERAKKVIEGNGLTNVRFIESTKLVWPDGVIKP